MKGVKMPQELKAFTVNLKSLDQNIDDPIVAGAGDANGRTFRLIFTQEAGAQFTEYTKVYLKWRHQQLDIKGYNVFKKVQLEGYPDLQVWEIHWPKAMLHEGDVLCCIEIVDDVSIAPSTNFIVHVLADPNDGSSFLVSDDYTVFNQAVIDMNSVAEKAEQQFQDHQEKFDDMVTSFNSMWNDVSMSLKKANAAIDIAQCALKQVAKVDSATGVFMNDY